MNMTRRNIAKKIIQDNFFFTIASSENNIPWITPVFYSFDDHFNFYWYSGKNTTHSRNLMHNKNASIVIFNSQFKESDPTEEGFGVYMRGVVSEVTSATIVKALRVYFARAVKEDAEREKNILHAKDFLGSSPLRMYMFTPKEITMSDTPGKWHDKWIDSRSIIVL